MIADLELTVERAAAAGSDPSGGVAVGDELWTWGDHGRLAVSRDGGARWNVIDTGTDTCLRGVARARGGELWVVGDAGFAARGSADRLTRVELETTADLTAVSAIGDEVVVLGGDGAIRRWRAGKLLVVATGAAERLSGVVVIRHGMWLVVGARGLVLRSPDGAWFSRARAVVDCDLEAVAVTTDHVLVAVGARGSVLVSRDDGRAWQVMEVPGAPHLRTVAAVGVGVRIGGDDGLIARLAPEGATELEVPTPSVAHAEPIVVTPSVAHAEPVADAPTVVHAEPIVVTPSVAHAEPITHAAALDPARVRAALALSMRAVRLAPDDDEIQLAHAMLLLDGARAGLDGARAELRARMASLPAATREHVGSQLAQLGEEVASR